MGPRACLASGRNSERLNTLADSLFNVAAEWLSGDHDSVCQNDLQMDGMHGGMNPAFYETACPGVGISREGALRAITIKGAIWLRADKQIGSLEVGKVADIIVLERNYFGVPEEELGRHRVVLTKVSGEVVYFEDGPQATLGQDVTGKFPKDSGVAVKMARIVVGGIDGSELDLEARTEVARLRKRQDGCGHEH